MAPGGRSTGCRTCRMRHLKCDEARPTCNRCTKAGIECRGYETIDVFVDERSRILERGSRSKAERRKPADLTLSHRFKGAGKNAKQSTPPSTSFPSTSTVVAHNSPRWTSSIQLCKQMPPHSSLSSEDDMYLNFMREKLLMRLPGTMIAQANVIRNSPVVNPTGWLMPALVNRKLEPPLDSSVNAVTRVWFGKLHKDPRVTAQGMLRYGKALSELKVALAQGRWHERDILTSSLCLVLYEAIMQTDEDAWINHARGLARLIEAQGPQAFQDPIGIGILRAMRYSTLMSAMILDEPAFLAKQEWCTVPWQLYPSLKTDNDYLFGIFARIPGFVKRLRAAEAGKVEDTEDLFNDIIPSIHDLFHWRWSYEMSHPNCAWIEDFESSEPACLFPITISFSTLFDIHVLSLYSSQVIFLLWLAKRAKGETFSREEMVPPPPDTLVKSNPLTLPGVDKLDVIEIAREICQMIRFRLKFTDDSSVAFGWYLPTHMAYQVLKDFPIEEKWLSDVAKSFEDNSGIRFPRLAFWRPRWLTALPTVR